MPHMTPGEFLNTYGFNEHVVIYRGINDSISIASLLSLYHDYALDEAAKAVKMRSTSCGDSMTCGCQGNCEHPKLYIDKKSITQLKIQK